MAYYDDIAALSPDFWWRLDGEEFDSADALDSDGGVDPSWVSSIIPALSSVFECGDYNGSSSVTTMPTSSNLIGNAATTKKSISVWIVADTIDTSGNGRIIWGEGGSVNAVVLYLYNNGGTLTLYGIVYESSGGTMDIVSVTGIETGTLYHVVLTMDAVAGELILYINGSLVDSKTGGLNIGSDLSSHTGGVGIGGPDSSYVQHDGSSTLNGYFDGRIADVVYWGEQTVLSSTEVAAIYASGLGVSYEQEGYQFRLDDGNESGATDIGAQDSDISSAKQVNRRLRILSDVTGDPASEGVTIQFRKVGDPDSEWESVS